MTITTDKKNVFFNLTEKQERLINALKRNAGILLQATKEAKIPYPYHFKWLKENPDYAMAYCYVKEQVVDWVESKLYQLIQNGNTAAILFFLKTKGRHRGYQEIQKIETKNLNVGMIWDLKKLQDEEKLIYDKLEVYPYERKSQRKNKKQESGKSKKT